MSDEAVKLPREISLDRQQIKDFIREKLADFKETVVDAVVEILPWVPHYQEENNYFSFRILMGCEYPPMGWDRKIYSFSGEELDSLHKAKVRSCLKDIIHFCKNGCDLIILQMPSSPKSDTTTIQFGIFQSDLGNSGETERALLEKGFLLVESVNRNKICIYSGKLSDKKNHLMVRFDLDEDSQASRKNEENTDSYPKGFWAGLFSQVKREVHGTICLFVDPAWDGNEDKNFDDGKVILEDREEMRIKPDSMLKHNSFQELYEQNFIRKSFISMLNFDGITVVDLDGCIRAYHCFVAISRGKDATGGARHRAYRALANLFKENEYYKAIYFQSQEGNIRFYHDSRVSFGFDPSIMNNSVVLTTATGMQTLVGGSDLSSMIDAKIEAQAQNKIAEEVKKRSYKNETIKAESLVERVERCLGDLWKAHIGIDNFFSEPKVADCLCKAVKNLNDEEWAHVDAERIINVPLACLVGNSYGYSTNAEPNLKAILELIPDSIWTCYLSHKCYEDTSLISTFGNRNQETQWLKLRNECATTEDGKSYVSGRVAEKIRIIYDKALEMYQKVFDESKELWERLFKGY